jgi:hypothetical protein
MILTDPGDHQHLPRVVYLSLHGADKNKKSAHLHTAESKHIHLRCTLEQFCRRCQMCDSFGN